jgi:hypothetical protein
MMPRLLKTGIGPLVVGLALLVNLQFHLMITPALAAEDKPENKPQVWLGPEVKIKSKTPAKSDKAKKGWFARNKWWVALGVILAGGTVAALAAGGGSDDENDGSDGTFSSDW